MAITPRLSLNLPSSSDNIDVVTALTNQLQKIDDIFDATVCTSTTHPSISFDGQLIYETDTGNLAYGDIATGSWKVFTNGRNPLGRLGFISSTAAGNPISGTQEDGPYLSITFNAKKNRLYAIHYVLTTDHATGHNTPSRWVVIRASTTGVVNQSSPQIIKLVADVDDNGTGLSIRQPGGGTYFPNLDQTITIGIFNQSTAGSNQTLINGSSYHTLSVEDIGYYA